jgi:peptidyl-prolyl cis-trans isomerase D
MRKNMKIIMWVLLITFVLWGGSTAVLSRTRSTDYAGLSFGKKVSWKEYDQNYAAVQNQARLMYGEKFTEVKQYLNLQEQAWERILLLRQAAKNRITASDDEVIQTICSMPLFQDSSRRFVPDIYKRVIEYFLKVPAREFEDQIKGSIRIAKLRDKIIKDVGLSEDELKQLYKAKNEKINADYAKIEASDFKAEVNVTDADVNNYYQAHSQDFRTPARVNIEYIPFEYADYQKGVTVADEEAGKYYDGHKKDYEKELAEAKQKGASEQEAVLKIKDRVKKMLLEKKAQSQAADASSDVSYELTQQEHPDFAAVAKKFNLPVKESGFFAANEPIGEIGLSYTVGYEAFKLEPDQISPPVKGTRGRYIIRLKAKKESYIPPLDEIKDKVKEIVVLNEAKKLAAKKAQDLYNQVKQKMDAGSRFKDACDELKLQVKSTGLFTRQDSVPEIGKSYQFADVAFSCDAGKLAGVADIPDGSAIISVAEKTAIDEEKFEKEKDEFRKTALAEKQDEYFDKWFRKLKQDADVRIAVSTKDGTRKAQGQQAAPVSIPFDDF